MMRFKYLFIISLCIAACLAESFTTKDVSEVQSTVKKYQDVKRAYNLGRAVYKDWRNDNDDFQNTKHTVVAESVSYASQKAGEYIGRFIGSWVGVDPDILSSAGYIIGGIVADWIDYGCDDTKACKLLN